MSGFLTLSPPDNVTFARSTPASFVFSASGFPLTNADIIVNGQVIAQLIGVALTEIDTTNFTTTLTAASDFPPDYTYAVTPIGGWQGDSVTVEVDGDLLGTPVSQSRTMTLGEGYIGDHTAEGANRLLEQFKGSPEVQDLLASYTNRAQELEDSAGELLHMRSIDSATGHRLDGIGQIVNVGRAGRTDEQYRFRLRAEIAILTSVGTAFDLIKVLQLLVVMPTKDIEYEEYYPKTAYLRPRNFDVSGSDDLAAIIALLRRAAPAGTEVHHVYSLTETDDDNMFRFSDTADTTEAAASYGLENGTLCGVD